MRSTGSTPTEDLVLNRLFSQAVLARLRYGLSLLLDFECSVSWRLSPSQWLASLSGMSYLWHCTCSTEATQSCREGGSDGYAAPGPGVAVGARGDEIYKKMEVLIDLTE